MKRLGEILSKNGSAATSAEHAALSDTAEPIAVIDEGACPFCGGAGFVRVDRPVDHPRFGKAEPCSCVLNEAEEDRSERLQNLSNLGSLRRFTFEGLQADGREGRDSGFAKALEAAHTYTANPEGWLVLTGASGSGKTHLAAAIANERIRQGHGVLFMVVSDLLDRLRAAYDAGEGELDYDAVFERVRNAKLLILDDIDGPAPTPWAQEKLLQIVNHRYNAVLPTVFTSTAEVRDLDDRIASRFRDGSLTRIFALGDTGESGYRQIGGMSLDRLQEKRFASFHPHGAGRSQEEWDSIETAMRAAKHFAENPHGWLMLQGVNGCGKTHLAAAIANQVLRDGGSVFFAVVPDLLDHLRASFAPDRGAGYDKVFEEVRTAPLLILDDLGAQHSSPWAQEKLYQIVNYRTVAGLPGVVTTDRSDEQFRGYHERIFARVGDTSVATTVRILAPHYTLGRLPNLPEQGRRR